MGSSTLQIVRQRERICKNVYARLHGIKCQKTNIFIHTAAEYLKSHAHTHIAHGIPYFWQVLACLLPRTLGFYPRPVHVGFVVNKVASGQVLLPAILFSFASVIPPVLHSRSFVPHQHCSILTNDRIVKQHRKYKPLIRNKMKI